MDRMQAWREGLVSDSEVIQDLLLCLYEVQQAMHKKETEAADKAFAKSESSVAP